MLDSREKQEFKTSHLKGAIFVGYDFFNVGSIEKQLQNRNAEIESGKEYLIHKDIKILNDFIMVIETPSLD